MSGIRKKDFWTAENFEQLVNSVKELLWYLSPHVQKLAAQSFHVSGNFKPLSILTNPMRQGHKVPDIIPWLPWLSD